jgi:translation elongation factor EF-1beta
MQATQNMQEAQMSFNLQYLQLQNSMQDESRQFTMVSNVMKTKNDTAKNAISNMK